MTVSSEDRPSAALAPETIDRLRPLGAEVVAAEGETVVRRGDRGTSFWVVLEGRVEVRLTGEDGVHLPLARLGPGSSFGEMALVTGDPVSADVVALAGSLLLRLPAEGFREALGADTALRDHVMARLAHALRGTSSDVWNFYQQAKALNVVMGPQREEGPIVARSGAMRPVLEAVAGIAAGPGPALVTGAAGTGKRFIAGKIHEASGGRPGAFIAVDCRALAARDAMGFLFGSDAGLGAGGRPADGTLRRYGALQLAHRGTLVLRHVELLPAPAQTELARYLAGRASGSWGYPEARVVGTSRRAPEELASALEPRLAEALAGRALALPPMAERRRDIVELARLFLDQRGAAAPARALGRDAEHALVSLRYAHGNAAELREAVEMAALIAEEELIGAEHVFAGPKAEAGVHEIDLTGIALVRRLLAPRVLATVRAIVLLSFAAVAAASLLAPATAVGVAANAITWGLWEPAVFAGFLLVGRVWCTVCPLSTAARLASRLGCLGLTPGPRLKSAAPWLMVAGFLLIVWTEHAFDMTGSPRAAGALLAGLFAAATAFALVYRREAWCRHVCALGNYGAAYALPAVLGVRSNPDVCATSCTTHECFKGAAGRPGCPVYHHPLYASDAHSCKLCFQCIRICPHGSARLRLRLPLQAVWGQGEVGDALVPFALFLVLFSPAMLAVEGTSWTATLPGLAAAALVAVAGAAALRPALARLPVAGRAADPGVATRVALALLVLAWGPAMSYQLGHVGFLRAVRLHAEAGTFAAQIMPAGEISLLLVLQLGVVLFAAAGAAACLLGVRARQRRDGGTPSRAGWTLLAALAACYLLGTIALVVAGGVHP